MRLPPRKKAKRVALRDIRAACEPPVDKCPPMEQGMFPGRILCDLWTLEACVGSGAMASVWAASDAHGRRVALKILHESVCHDRTTRHRFRREAIAANLVRHPAITSILGHGTTSEGRVFLVMELLEGQTLKELLTARGRLSPLDVAAMALAMLEGLDAAHAAGIIHRDIKPDNVMLTHGGRIKLLDLGIARLEERSLCAYRTSTGVMLGTPAYMPPEQALGRRAEIDERSDVFAVGATMFRLITGETVHVARSFQSLLIAAATARARPIRSVCPGLDRGIAHVIDRALRFEPKDRWSTAARMRLALATSLDPGTLEGAVEATSPGGW